MYGFGNIGLLSLLITADNTFTGIIDCQNIDKMLDLFESWSKWNCSIVLAQLTQSIGERRTMKVILKYFIT